MLRVAGRLDQATAGDLEAQCVALLDEGATRMVIDVSELEYISSAGLRVILATAKRLRPAGGGIAVCGAAGVVAEALTIAGFASLLPITDDLEAAMAEL